MKHLTLLFFFLLSTFYCAAQAPLAFINFPLNSTHSIHPKGFYTYNGKMYFNANVGPYGEELWATDGTVAGTNMVKDILEKPNTYNYGSYPGDFIELNGKMIFAADDGRGRELWISDGTNAGTQLLKEIYPGTGPSNPGYFIKLGNKLIFNAQEPGTGIELWVTDGTAAGTQMLKDIKPGTSSSYPYGHILFNGRIYFGADNGSSTALWETDGTAAGTKIAVNVKTTNLTEMSGKLYFCSSTTLHGNELWATDGTTTGTYMVKDIYPGYKNGMESNSVNPLPEHFAVYENKLYFSGKDSLNGYEPWCSDGTAAGTYMLRNIYPGIGGSYSLNNYAVYNGKLYFGANDSTHGSELWVTDGTTAGTHIVADLIVGKKGAGAAYPIVFGSYLYYKANSDSSGSQLVQTDGTAAGTKYIAPPTAKESDPLSNCREFYIHDSALYFTAAYDFLGHDFWALKDTTGTFRPPLANGNNSENIWLAVYPNPNKGMFTLESNSPDFIGSMLRVYNMLGERIWQGVADKQKMQINMSGVANGVYMIKVWIRNKVYTKPVVIFE